MIGEQEERDKEDMRVHQGKLNIVLYKILKFRKYLLFVRKRLEYCEKNDYYGTKK